ncbi:hypothetical protein M9458_058176, partial [Cirrhinus mrigala]
GGDPRRTRNRKWRSQIRDCGKCSVLKVPLTVVGGSHRDRVCDTIEPFFQHPLLQPISDVNFRQ